MVLLPVIERGVVTTLEKEVDRGHCYAYGCFTDSLSGLQHSASSNGVCSSECKGQVQICSGCVKVLTTKEQCSASKVS